MTLWLLALSLSTMASVVGLVCSTSDGPEWCRWPHAAQHTSPNPLSNTRGVDVTLEYEWEYESELLYQEGF